VSKTEHIETLLRITNLPTAPFVEDHVAAFVRRFVKAHPQLRLRADRFGNLLVKYTPRRRSRRRLSRPVLFAAHMDHPGFIAGRPLGKGRIQAEWAGGVQSRYFKGTKIRFHVDDRWVPGVVEKVVPQRLKKADPRPPAEVPPKAVVARVRGDVPRGSLGMWHLPDAAIRGNRLYARVTDDLSGLAAIICSLDEVCRRNVGCPCYAFFTRAEEVGFAGALAAVVGKTVPQRTIVVAVENSSVIPGVTLGNGPILRVGDKFSVFTPEATAYCRAVADDLAKKDKTFQYQRKLMDGGSCESTAYCHYGYEATGICLPLMNYHNMDKRRGKIAPEINDVSDYLNLVKWFVALAESPANFRFGGRDAVVGKKLDGLEKRYRARLMRAGQA
jgi:endoglucanase